MEKHLQAALDRAGVYSFVIIFEKNHAITPCPLPENQKIRLFFEYITGGPKRKGLNPVAGNNFALIEVEVSGDSHGVNDGLMVSSNELSGSSGEYLAKFFCYVDRAKQITITVKNRSDKAVKVKNLIGVEHIWSRQDSFLQGCEQWEVSQRFYGEDYYTSSKENAESGYCSNYRENALKNQRIFTAPFFDKLHYDTSLEIGTSMGGMLKLSLEAGKNAYGIDYSFFALKNSFSEVRERIFCADLFNLPLAKDCFDLVIAQEVLEHVYPQQILPALKQIYGVCRKYFVMTVPCGGGFLPEFVTSFDELAKDKDGNPREGHITVANINWWKEQVIRAGFYLNEDLAIEISKSWGIYSSWWQLIIGEKRELPENYTEKFYMSLFSSAYEKLRGKVDDVLHIEGTVTNDPEIPGAKVVVIKKDDQCGYILFGPYIKLEKGKYRAIFELKIGSNHADPDSDVILLEVKSQFGGKIHGNNIVKVNSFKLTNRYQKFDILFESSGEDGIEFTAYFCGKVDLSLKVPVSVNVLSYLEHLKTRFLPLFVI